MTFYPRHFTGYGYPTVGLSSSAFQNESYRRERLENERNKFYATQPNSYAGYSERHERYKTRLFWEAYEHNKHINPSSNLSTAASESSSTIHSKEYYPIRSAHDSVLQKVKNVFLQTITFTLWGKYHKSKFKEALKANQLEAAKRIFQKGCVWKISDKSLKPHIQRRHIATLVWLVEKEFKALNKTGPIASETNKMIKDWK